MKTLYIFEDEDYQFKVLAGNNEDKMSPWTRKVTLTEEEYTEYKRLNEERMAYGRMISELHDRGVEIRPDPRVGGV